MCSVGGIGVVETCADGPNWSRSKTFGTETLEGLISWQCIGSPDIARVSIYSYGWRSRP